MNITPDTSADPQLSREDALAILNTPDESLEELISFAETFRRKYKGNHVSIHILTNARSGNCSQDRTAGQIAVITDRDSCIAVGGIPRRELAGRRLSTRLESLMEGRQSWQSKGERLPVCEDSDKYRVVTAVPILSEGDVLGCVLFLSADDNTRLGETELKLAQTVAGFLGKHMES